MHVHVYSSALSSCVCREGFGPKGLHFPVVVAQSGYTIMCGPYTYGYVLSPCIG